MEAQGLKPKLLQTRNWNTKLKSKIKIKDK